MRKTVTLLITLLCWHANGDDRFANIQVTSEHIAGSVHMLKGAGGNIGVSAGDEGILIVDDQYEPMAEKIAAALKDINPSAVKYVINTHLHGDHTGSNAWFREVQDATIFAHDNVRKRLADKDGHKHTSLPVVTYEHGVKFHFNGETIEVMHLNSGHTDGDSAVRFVDANVLHTGDLFFKDRFPYVDKKSGGTVKGYINSVSNLIDSIDESTVIIPGHGTLADKADYQRFLDMMKATLSFVQQAKTAGKTVEQVVEQGLEEKWQSWGAGFINEERWIKTLY